MQTKFKQFTNKESPLWQTANLSGKWIPHFGPYIILVIPQFLLLSYQWDRWPPMGPEPNFSSNWRKVTWNKCSELAVFASTRSHFQQTAVVVQAETGSPDAAGFCQQMSWKWLGGIHHTLSPFLQQSARASVQYNFVKDEGVIDFIWVEVKFIFKLGATTALTVASLLHPTTLPWASGAHRICMSSF